ncbi:MAG: sulfotransferase domain-containing protein [Proteobacteria bacterium]|uniref:Sulfotransferase n=1 Tax=Thermomonas beijingensis TaxID=2872701 RepID=A0ABS7TEU9_9GAMM|nr:sulfotransferase domain-containing protein [Thermomonas beijingensis]MBS0460065.1 sulfotransferase domain-containing protein [Pseudomonadota bacterium]MBZ4186395.1 sulfotransferase [Thermomonas beijingensis]
MTNTPTEPRIAFLIGGVQKAGTSALAQYLSAHPQLRLPYNKEAHVFDAEDFDDGADTAAIDARFAPLFTADAGTADTAATLHGDATPISLFLPQCLPRITRYNPALRWIVLLREPAERALSHYRMERARGWEHWPLWPAMLLERWRLRLDRDPLATDSHHRRHSYRARGDYAQQLDRLYAQFPSQHVLLLRSEQLRTQPATCVAQVCAFLGVPAPPANIDYAPVFVSNTPPPARNSLTMRLLRWLLRRERRALRERYGITFD